MHIFDLINIKNCAYKSDDLKSLFYSLAKSAMQIMIVSERNSHTKDKHSDFKNTCSPGKIGFYHFIREAKTLHRNQL